MELMFFNVFPFAPRLQFIGGRQDIREEGRDYCFSLDKVRAEMMGGGYERYISQTECALTTLILVNRKSI